MTPPTITVLDDDNGGAQVLIDGKPVACLAWCVDHDELQRLASALANAMLERAAKQCIEIAEDHTDRACDAMALGLRNTQSMNEGQCDGARECAIAILAGKAGSNG
ncbi:MAG: hypothetical protein WC718_16325 [Phycisphaerales bacterium]|jgi:hypothetical protein